MARLLQGDPPRRAASIRDVASAAGVSHQTVSRVINNHPNVSPTTRAAVLDVVEQLRFRPNRVARALARGAAATVTVLTSETSLYGYAETIRGVEEAARAAGVEVGISVIASAEEEVIARAVESVSVPGAGAVVVIAFDRAGAGALEALPSHVRYAAAVESALGRDLGAGSGAVWFEEVTAARAATDHLLALGHRTVHHISVPSSGRGVNDRETGWTMSLGAAGVPVPATVSSLGWDAASGYAAGIALLGDESVSAVFCGNDDIAVGCLRAAIESGRRVPDDLSVVGFDDVPMARFLVPALTTVRLDFAALGRRAFGLLDPVAGQPAEMVPEPELMVRESSGPPVSAHARRARLKQTAPRRRS